jgi:hypothetical protein
MDGMAGDSLGGGHCSRMRNVQDPLGIEIYMCDPFGVRFALLDYVIEMGYTRISNDIAPFYLKVPSPKYSWLNNRLDNIVEIVRGGRRDYVGLLRAWNYGVESGMRYCELVGESPISLLARRQVASYMGADGADMTDYADDMIKVIAYNEMGAGASAGRSYTNTGGGFTIEQENSLAPSISKSFSHKNLLEVCQEIASASQQAGTRLYFDLYSLTPSITTGQIAFQLKTWINYRGNDRSDDSSSPVFIGTDWGNLDNATLEYNHLEEINSVCARGSGVGPTEETLIVTDTERAAKSIWNLREGTVVTDAEPGEVGHLTADANTYLNEQKPKTTFVGDVVENPYFRYGRDYGFGDLVTIAEWNQWIDANIDRVQVSMDSSGKQTITSKLSVEI